MWLRLILVFVAAAAISEAGLWTIGHGGDDFGAALFDRCSRRATDHWGWLESDSRAPAAKTLRVLLIGNSLTYTNDLPGVLVKVASSDPSDPITLKVRSVTAPDASLTSLWNEGCGQRRLATDHYDLVILQEHSFFWAPDAAEAARTSASQWFVAARTAGATPLYFQPWVSPPDQGAALSDVNAMKEAVRANAEPYGASIVRVGEAFAEAAANSGAPDLYQSDRHHPNVAGTYLAALVLFHRLSGEPAERSTWLPDGMSADQARLLARIADQYG